MNAAEGVPVKDGLGPKIWTGTHFLPRFLRQSDVPGEGLCYFYDDGTHCKTVIDGEQVNAHWGVTKAGKPRKRLAIACLTCREKKIKCDPDFPRCVQCEKFGRVCRFKNAPRGGHNTSPGASPTREAEELRLPAHQQQPEETRQRRSESFESISPKTSSLKRTASSAHLVEPQPTKRTILDYERYAPPAGQTLSPMAKDRELTRTAIAWHDQTRTGTRADPNRELPRLSDDLRRRPWQQ
ncbi:white-opaque regulator 2 [Microdochium nivale]|nr:white-opaque regulator 2 [Microdochium nivale]